jgi:hypothetical protein
MNYALLFSLSLNNLWSSRPIDQQIKFEIESTRLKLDVKNMRDKSPLTYPPDETDRSISR